MTLQNDALQLAELDQQICRAIIAANTNRLGRLLNQYMKLRKSLKIQMLDEPVVSVEDSKAGEVLRNITSSDGLPSDIVVEHFRTLINGDGDSLAEEFDEVDFEELGSNLFYSWYSHYEYVGALVKMRPLILKCNPSESVKRLVNQVKGCYAFQQYDAAYGLCRTLLESSVYDICKRCELISKQGKYYIPIEKYKWDKLHKKVSTGPLRKKLRNLYRRLSTVLHAGRAATSEEALEVFKETLLVIEELYGSHEI